MTVLDWIKKQGYGAADEDWYKHIDTWQSWYRGNVKSFHNYSVYNGQTTLHCKRKSLNMAQQVAADWAGLLLNEKVHINHAQAAAQDYLLDVLDKNDFWVRGNQCIEDAFWSGLAAVIPVPDGVVVRDERVVQTAGETLCYATGRQIIPLTVKNRKCTECAFAFESADGDKQYTLLQMFTLENGVYVCRNHLFDTSNGGCKEVENPRAVKGYEDLAAEWNTGSAEAPFVFIKPNGSNTLAPESPFGMAVFAGAIDVLKGIDTVYDAYVNEYILGKTRVMVQTAAAHDQDGKPTFDPSDIAFYVLPEDVTGEPYVKPIQPDIRAAQMTAGLADNLNLLSLRCGFGERHYRFDAGGVATATQVISENSAMFRTMKKHEIILDGALKHLCRLILLHGALYGGKALDWQTPVTIDFDDSIIEDKETDINRYFRLTQAGAMGLAELRAKVMGESLEEAEAMLPAPEPEEPPGLDE